MVAYLMLARIPFEKSCRLEEELAPQCRKKCDEENEDSYLCNCQRLSNCAKEFSWYDMAVRTLGGYVSVDLDLYHRSCIVLSAF